MSHQKGRNAGVTGLVDILPGTPAFTMKVARYSRPNDTPALPRTGRGDARRRIRQSTPGTRLLLWGTVSPDGFPEPESLRGATGTVELQHTATAKQTLSVLVLDAGMDYDAARDELPRLALACEVTANPVYAGFAGTQTPAAADPSLNTVETHDGATKGIDPDAIQDSDTRRIDVEGLADTDAAEVTWVTGAIAAAVATRAGMKVRRADFARTDHWGGVLTVTFARTTTGEDLVNEASSKTIDPQNLASRATTAAINATAPTPTGASFKNRGDATREINDGVTLHTTEWGLTDTKDDAQNPRVTTTADPEHIEDVAVRAQVWATSGAAPSSPTDAPTNNVKLLGTTDLPLNPEEKLRVWAYGARSSRDERVLPQTETVDDASGLRNTALLAWLDGETAPDAPGTPWVLRFTKTTPVTVGLGVNRTLFVRVYGTTTTAQDVLFPKTRTETDAAAIEQEVLLPVLYEAGTSPTAPATPAGMVLFDTADTPETDGYGVRVYRYRYVNRQTEAERGRYELTTDPNGLRSTKMSGAVWDTGGAAPATPAAPAGLKLVDYRDLGIPSHPTKVVRVYRWALTDSVDDLVLPKTWTLTDPQGLASMASAAALNGTPTLPGGFVSRGTRAENVGGTNVLSITEGGLRNTLQDIEFPGTRHVVDTSSQVDADTVTTVTNSASYSPPTNLGSLPLRDYDRRQHVPGVYVYEARYGLWTRDAELVAKASRTQAPAARGRVDVDAVLASGTAPVSVGLGFGTTTASIDPTASIETAAEAVRTALLGDATFEAVDVERVTPSKLLLNLHRRGTRWWMELESRVATGLMTPWRLLGGGVVQVFVADLVQIRSGLWEYVIGEVPVACTIMDFVIWKTYTGDALYTNLNAAGMTNADTFMGMSALTVTYAGVTGPVAIKDSYRYPDATNGASVAFEGARTQGWKFRFDSRGIVAADGICPGYRQYTTSDLSGVSPRTWVNASTLGVSAASATPMNFTQAFLNTTP